MASPAGDAALAREALHSSPLFAGLDDATLMLCANAMRGRRFRRGEVLFHVEDPGDALFVVTSGEVKIVLPSEEGAEPVILTTIARGGFFGELALLDGRPRSASAIAVRAVEALVLRRDAFDRLVDAEPALRRAMFASLAGEVRRLTGQIADLHFLDLPGRLARHLLRMGGAMENGDGIARYRRRGRPDPARLAVYPIRARGHDRRLAPIGESDARGIRRGGPPPVRGRRAGHPRPRPARARRLAVTEQRRPSEPALELLAAIAARAEAAGRLEPPGGAAVLRSIVDATVVLFDAEAASIALYDAATDRLVFRVAAGAQGQGVVGVSIAPHEGVAGYVFSTGQPIAILDVAADPRFGASTAQQTGYVPRSILAVPLLDDEDSLGVLEILDRRSGEGFALRDVELAGVFARQATVAIRATRLERDTANLLRDGLRALASQGTGPVSEEALDELVEAAIGRMASDDDPLWTLADRVGRLRSADPGQVALLADLLDVLIRRAERQRSGRAER